MPSQWHLRHVPGPTAAAIRRLIRASGVPVLPLGTRPSVRGVRVTQARSLQLVTVVVDYELSGRSRRVAADIATDLRDLGYVVTANEDETILTVKHRV